MLVRTSGEVEWPSRSIGLNVSYKLEDVLPTFFMQYF